MKFEIIIKALKDAGCDVKVENNHPTKLEINELIEETQLKIKDGGTRKVKAIVNQLPWPG